MIFNDLSDVTSYLQSRRSARPRDLIAPGPDAQTLRHITQIASRTPDHGKLSPWRVVHVTPDQRGGFADRLASAYTQEKPDCGRLELETMHSFAHFAPQLLVVLYSPKDQTKIPLWEQQLACGAFCMNLVHATHARGFAAGWVTGWPSYNAQVRNAFGGAHEQIAGYIFIGTPAKPLEERPRPDIDMIFSTWQPAQAPPQ